MSAEAEAALADRLRAIPVAEMSDTLEAAGLPGRILHPDFRPFPPGVAGRRMAGPAVCLSGEASAAPGLAIRAVDGAVRAGCVVAVGPGEGCAAALVGGNMAAAWRIKGCAGLVVDGRLLRGAVGRLHHDLRDQAVRRLPVRRQLRRPLVAQEVLQRGQQARAHGRVVRGERAELAVVATQLLEDRHQRVQVVDPGHDVAQRGEQPVALVRHRDGEHVARLGVGQEEV